MKRVFLRTLVVACAVALASSEEVNINVDGTATATATNYNDAIRADPAIAKLLTIVREFSIAEMDTAKYESKPGAQMGSVFLKAGLKDMDLTFCSNEGWRNAERAMGLSKEGSFAPIFAAPDKCDVGQMYHMVGSGLGSWVSNVANLLYTCYSKQTTCSFHLGNPKYGIMNHRYEVLFGHEMPGCPTEIPPTKTKPMIVTNVIGSLKARDPCQYSAAKSFFVKLLWDFMTTGQLKGKLAAAVADHMGQLRSAFHGSVGSVGSVEEGAAEEGDAADVPYIAVHLRHKWEFKLQPPPVADIATLIRALPPKFNDGGSAFWGERVVVMCASDDDAKCLALGTELGEGYYVHVTGGRKLSAGDDGFLQYLLDVSLLQRAAIFVGTGSSNLGRLANAIRGPEKLSLSLDVSFNAVHF